MKKITLPALILTTLALLTIPLTQADPAAAGTYATRQLDTGMISDDLFPAINNAGAVVWYHAACQFQTGDPPVTYTEAGRYYFYQGGSFAPLNVPANNDPPWNYSHAPLPLLNHQGQVGYLIQDYKGDGNYKIYFHDGPVDAPQLASSTASLPGEVQLNGQGRMAWSNYDANTILQVYLFNNGQGPGTRITNYTDPGGYEGYAGGLSLNDAGHLVWIERAYEGNTLTYRIRRHQGGETQSIHSTAGALYFTRINNQGKVTWLEQNPNTGNGDIMLYDGGSVAPLPGGEGFPWGRVSPDLQINDQGQVIWLGANSAADSQYNIFLYGGGGTTQVTHYTDAAGYASVIDLQENWDNAKTMFAPRLNNNGEIVWATAVPNSANPNHLDLGVHVYGGGKTTQLDRWTVDPRTFSNWAVNALHAVYAQINDAGQVVWSRYRGTAVPDLGSDFRIYLATPVTLADAVRYLQILTRMDVSAGGDATGDNKIGLEEVIAYLQSAAGLR